MHKIKILSYDGVKGKGWYLDSKTLNKVKFTYHQFADQAVTSGFAYLDDNGMIHAKKESWFSKLFKRGNK